MARTYEDILGSAKVHEIAAFWRNSAPTMSEVKRIILFNRCERGSFNDTEYEAFREGVAEVLLFMEGCLITVEQAQESPTGNK